MFDAIYTRQSIDKADSISVESQLEYCKYETRGNEYKTYTDKGYSGKNTNRPAFEEMMKDIKAGKISRVIVYKLDRISRSILDFANMMDIFAEHNVEFVSSTERFDTSTPIGRAMLNICIVFAQLERETIQKRVADAYYSRSKRGFYMGGRIPYGFAKTDTVIDGIKTSKFVTVPEEAEQIRLMYSMYSDGTKSLGDIISYFNENGIKELRGGSWSAGRISNILRNPIYVSADADVYDFFKSQGADVINPVSDYTGENGCYLYQGTKSKTRKQLDLTDKEIVLAPHKGIVSSSDWIKCRIRCLNNRQSTRTQRPSTSWLVGKVKCGKCGYALKVVKANTKWHRYFVCSLSLESKRQNCKGTGGTVYLDVLEEYMLGAIRKKLSEFKKLTAKQDKKNNPKLNADKIKMSQIDNEIDDLLSKVVGANEILMEYINKKIAELDKQKKELQEDILMLTHSNTADKFNEISNHIDTWDKLSFEDKQAVVDTLIKVIYISDGKIEIIWNI